MGVHGVAVKEIFKEREEESDCLFDTAPTIIFIQTEKNKNSDEKKGGQKRGTGGAKLNKYHMIVKRTYVQ